MSNSLPIINEADSRSGLHPGKWWHADGDRTICTLCPRECSMKDGDRGFCFVRQNVGGEMMLTTYGRSTGFCIDPIEKKPLNHFYPGTSILSFGTAGCNLGCKFCQNWDISKAREVERLSHRAWPDEIAHACKSLGCHSVAFTYNDPIIWAEYAIDTAKACREAGVKSVAVTAGYISAEARAEFFEFFDAANVDLKAFTEEFYHKITYSHLEPVLDTLSWLKHETDVWFEITNLVIPDANDSPDEIKQMCDWVLNAVGDDVPIHFSAFHPDFRMTEVPNTPHETLVKAREIAQQTGIKHVYVGNVNDAERQSTYCPNCKNLVIERNWYALGVYAMNGNQCRHCGETISGHFASQPGNWGRKRQPVDMRQFHLPHHQEPQQSPQRPIEDGLGESMNTAKNENEIKLDPSALEWLASQQSNSPTAQPVQAASVDGPVASSQPKTDPQAVQYAPQVQVKQPEPNTPPKSMALDAKQRNAIQLAAGEFVKAATESRGARIPDLTAVGVANAAVSGIFVSLKRDGKLRSCCGSFGGSMPLQKTLHESAVRTATNDPRFPPVSSTEIPHLDMEIWLLFAPEHVLAVGEARIGEIEIGKHGLQIIRGNSRGLLLPGVATDNGWDSETFLNQVCVKASLPPTAWKEPDTILYRFEGNVIKSGLVTEEEAKHYQATRLIYQPNQITELAQVFKDNINAVIRGATPMLYCNVPDTTVNGVSLRVKLPGRDNDISLVRMSLRDPMPLQSTAFQMCQDIAAALRRRGFLNGNFELDIAIAYDPAMHGTVRDASIGGIDSQTRAVMVTERQKSAWVFDQSKNAEELVAAAAKECQVSEPAMAQLFSVGFQSTRTELSHAALPKPVRGPSERPASVAGKFYPADLTEMNKQLDQMLSGDATPEPCKAAMVPHAGWQFSGRLAANVFQRIRLSKSVIIIGPKHTPHGSEWAVAPHNTWQLPGENLLSDYMLADRLATEIDGLEMDAAAHQNEHAIEVELPIIQRLAPETNVVGIAIGAGNLERCEQFATGLAKVIEQMEEKPLLIISSDMNHFANDEETRRLDAMALADLDKLDEDALFNTCRNNQISMCGMLPAVIVLKTLKKLGGVHQSRKVGYATSADVTGDTSRVVGYAGRIFQ
jgi:AmmeMemoRadiSam system radical SAM enzyme/AmmeMemoRadiSam system protein B/AmmeMemoRadiSam system protein A